MDFGQNKTLQSLHAQHLLKSYEKLLFFITTENVWPFYPQRSIQLFSYAWEEYIQRNLSILASPRRECYVSRKYENEV